MVGGISVEQYRPNEGWTHSTTTTSVSVVIQYVCQVQPKQLFLTRWYTSWKKIKIYRMVASSQHDSLWDYSCRQMVWFWLLYEIRLWSKGFPWFSFEWFIDNRYENFQFTCRETLMIPLLVTLHDWPRSGIGIQINTTKFWIVTKDGRLKTQSMQVRCR